MATGLMALVDDCIKKRWPDPKVHRSPLLDRLRLETTTNVAKVARIIGYYAKGSVVNPKSCFDVMIPVKLTCLHKWL